MAGDFAVLMRNGGGLGPILVEDLDDLAEAIQKAKEISASRKVTCLVYCYKENLHKYRFDPRPVRFAKTQVRAIDAVLQAAVV